MSEVAKMDHYIKREDTEKAIATIRSDGNRRWPMTYENFIANKAITTTSSGITVPVEELNPMLFDFQRDIVRWALAKGRAAIFADCGDGKTAMQLEWAEQIRRRTGGKVLIVAPLAVSAQTQREGEKFGVKVRICASQDDVTADSVNITNYEKLDKFVASEFKAIVLDESSIIKSFSGKIRNPTPVPKATLLAKLRRVSRSEEHTSELQSR